MISGDQLNHLVVAPRNRRNSGGWRPVGERKRPKLAATRVAAFATQVGTGFAKERGR